MNVQRIILRVVHEVEIPRDVGVAGVAVKPPASVADRVARVAVHVMDPVVVDPGRVLVPQHVNAGQVVHASAGNVVNVVPAQIVVVGPGLTGAPAPAHLHAGPRRIGDFVINDRVILRQAAEEDPARRLEHLARVVDQIVPDEVFAGDPLLFFLLDSFGGLRDGDPARAAVEDVVPLNDVSDAPEAERNAVFTEVGEFAVPHETVLPAEGVDRAALRVGRLNAVLVVGRNVRVRVGKNEVLETQILDRLPVLPVPLDLHQPARADAQNDRVPGQIFVLARNVEDTPGLAVEEPLARNVQSGPAVFQVPPHVPVREKDAGLTRERHGPRGGVVRLDPVVRRAPVQVGVKEPALERGGIREFLVRRVRAETQSSAEVLGADDVPLRAPALDHVDLFGPEVRRGGVFRVHVRRTSAGRTANVRMLRRVRNVQKSPGRGFDLALDEELRPLEFAGAAFFQRFGSRGGEKAVSFIFPAGKDQTAGNDGALVRLALPDDRCVFGAGVRRSENQRLGLRVTSARELDCDGLVRGLRPKIAHGVAGFFERRKRCGLTAVSGIGTGRRDVKRFGVQAACAKQRGGAKGGKEEVFHGRDLFKVWRVESGGWSWELKTKTGGLISRT